MEETWTVGAVPDDVEDVAERVTSMARLKRRHTQAIETERRLAQKTEALQSTLEALPAVAPAAASASELSSALLGGALQLGGELVSQGWPNARDWEQPGEAEPADAAPSAAAAAAPAPGVAQALIAEAAAAEAANGRGGAVPAEVLERLARDTDRAADEGSWPLDPLAATSAEEVERQRPPPDFFASVRLRVAVGRRAAPGALRRLMTVTLDPAVRTLPELIAAAAAAFAIEARHVESIVKAPDVLLADDDDVRWLSDGDEIHLLLLGETEMEATDGPQRTEQTAALPLALTEVSPNVAVLVLPGRAGERGWSEALHDAWLASLLAHGWDAWELIGQEIKIDPEEVNDAAQFGAIRRDSAQFF